MAQQLLTAFGGGIAAPSANRYGRLSPTRAEHVREELGDAVRVILDGGECQIGLESTIVAFDGAHRCACCARAPSPRSDPRGGRRTPPRARIATRRACRAARSTHYAPQTPLSIVPTGQIDTQAAALSAGGRRIAVLAQRLPLRAHTYVTWVNAGRRPDQYGHALYTQSARAR